MKGHTKGIRLGGGTSGNMSRKGRMIHKKPMKVESNLGKNPMGRPQRFVSGSNVPNMMPLRK